MGTLNMKEHQLRSYDKLVQSVRSFEWLLKEIIWSYYEWNMRGLANTVMSSQLMHLKKVTSFRCFNQIIINNHYTCHMSYITSCSFLWLSVYLFIFLSKALNLLFCPLQWHTEFLWFERSWLPWQLSALCLLLVYLFPFCLYAWFLVCKHEQPAVTCSQVSLRCVVVWDQAAELRLSAWGQT